MEDRYRPSAIKRLIGSEHFAGWAFVAPAVILIAIFFLIPIGWSLLISLQANNLIAPAHYVGLANYKALTKDPAFRSAIGHTLLYTVIFVPVSVGGALALAVALNRKIRGIRFYRLAVFVPLVTSTVATGLVFLWLLDPTFGFVNYVLHAVGLPQQQFLQDPNQALYCIIAMTMWGWLGFDVIVYLAALQGVPEELLEAAEIDGASKWSRFRSIVVPLLGPAIFASAVLVFSGVIDDFVIVDLLSSNAGNTPMSVIIYSTQHGGNGGPALNALGTIMLVMSLVIAFIGYLAYRYATRGERGSRIDALTSIAGSE